MRLIHFREGKPYNCTFCLFDKYMWIFFYIAFKYKRTTFAIIRGKMYSFRNRIQGEFMYDLRKQYQEDNHG